MVPAFDLLLGSWSLKAQVVRDGSPYVLTKRAVVAVSPSARFRPLILRFVSIRYVDQAPFPASAKSDYGLLMSGSTIDSHVVGSGDSLKLLIPLF